MTLQQQQLFFFTAVCRFNLTHAVRVEQTDTQNYQKVITESWARCRFQGAGGSGGGGEGVTIEDRASGQILAEYASSAKAEALGLLLPAEAR